MGYWKKHRREDIEAVLEAFDAAGWRVQNPPTFYRVLCPCGDHQRSIHLTPSGTNYGRNALMWLYRQPCYPQTEGQEGAE